MRTRRLAPLVTLVAFATGSCKDDAKNDHPPPPPPPVASTHADLCAGGGGTDTDAISAPFVPRAAGGYCIDPQTEIKTYGDKGKLTMDEVCTTACDGECEVYKRFGLDRVVVLRYVDNPNGSQRDIAGILSERRNVMGLMPHPERASDPLLGSTDGRVIFESMVNSLVTSAA